MHALAENELLGERRVQAFLTVISAASVAIGLAANRTSVHALLAIEAGVSFLLTVLRFLTNLRIAQHDTATSQYKLDLYRMRRYIAGTGKRLMEALAFMNNKILSYVPDLVGFQNSAMCLDLGFYAARSYSLRRPPRTGRRLICCWQRSAARWPGRAGAAGGCGGVVVRGSAWRIWPGRCAGGVRRR